MKRTLRMIVCGGMLVCAAHLAGAQGITFDTTDAHIIFAVGNTISYHADTLTTSADIGVPGHTSWDFGALNSTAVTNMKSLALAASPYAANFPQATHVLRDTAFTFSFYYAALSTTVTLNGTGYVYYGLRTSLLNYGLKGGGNAYLFGNAYPAQGQWLNAPSSTDYDLPLVYGKTWTTGYTESISGTATLGTIAMPFGPIETKHVITYTVDAYGTLALPVGQPQQALRIRKMDRFDTGTSTGTRAGYIFLMKNGGTVQLTLNDTTVTGGTTSVNSIRWAPGSRDVNLPIQLASFTATQGNSSSVSLEWTTLTETDNFGFYVQRKGSHDPAFTEVPGSFVAGHGTTVVPQKYGYIDNFQSGGSWWYRLEQVDLDGTVHYSEPVQVTALTGVQDVIPTSFALEQNYPNPFNPSTKIRYTVASGGAGVSGLGSGWVRLGVYDMLGREVAVLVNEQQQPGSYEVTFNGAHLSSGVYVYKLVAGSFVQSSRMMLVK